MPIPLRCLLGAQRLCRLLGAVVAWIVWESKHGIAGRRRMRAGAGIAAFVVVCASVLVCATTSSPVAAVVSQLESCGGPMVSVGETFYFDGADGTHGCSLWKTDGTGPGTVMVEDLDMRSPSGLQSRMAAIGGELYFTAYDSTHGEELWKSDGTAAGTVIVKDIGPGDEGGYVGTMVVIGNTLYFGASDGSRAGGHGSELWKSDGTDTGTVLVKDINPGTTNSNPIGLTVVGNSLYFVADDGTHGEELWRSDGTDLGTGMVKDIDPGPMDAMSAASLELTRLGDTLYFAADDGTNGVELWRSDGTDAGTERVASTGPSPDPGMDVGTDPEDLTAMGGVLYFAGTGPGGVELWRSDGTAAGTVRVSDVNPGDEGSYPSELTAVGHTLFFRAQDSVHGGELWSSDGTTSGTALIKDVYPGISDRLSSYGLPNSGWPDQLTAWGNAVYFRAAEATHGTELWRSDGTDAGTVMVKDIDPGAAGSDPSDLTVIGSRLYLRAGGNHGPEPWTSDGTDLGTIRLIDVTAGTTAGTTTGATNPPAAPTTPAAPFRLPAAGRADLRHGVLTLRVHVPGSGMLTLTAANRAQPVKTRHEHATTSGDVSMRVTLTRAGMKRLKAKLAAAKRHHKKRASIRVRIAVTYTSSEGKSTRLTHAYRLSLGK